jgi:hypothetical protein
MDVDKEYTIASALILSSILSTHSIFYFKLFSVRASPTRSPIFESLTLKYDLI